MTAFDVLSELDVFSELSIIFTLKGAFRWVLDFLNNCEPQLLQILPIAINFSF